MLFNKKSEQGWCMAIVGAVGFFLIVIVCFVVVEFFVNGVNALLQALAQ